MESPAIRSYGGLLTLQAGQPQGIAPTLATIPLLSGLFCTDITSIDVIVIGFFKKHFSYSKVVSVTS